jgi:hypothetical protein
VLSTSNTRTNGPPVDFISSERRRETSLSHIFVTNCSYSRPEPKTSICLHLERVPIRASAVQPKSCGYSGGSIAEILNRKETGLLTETRSSEVFAAALCDLFRDCYETTSCVIKNARTAWIRNFQLDRFGTVFVTSFMFGLR